jgi:hypothetical protein
LTAKAAASTSAERDGALRIRYERCDDIHEAFLAIGCSLICFKLLQGQGVILVDL